MNQTLFLKTPKSFDFKETIFGHGWYQLLPFEFNQENQSLKTVIKFEKPVSIEIFEAENALQIEVDDELNTETKDKILRNVSHIFRFDEQLSDFYQLIKTDKNLKWIANQKAGRLLRSPTVFEDLVKTICTTNCNWAMTKIMVTNLVEKLGEVSKNGKRSFPTAEAMAKMPIEFYKEEIRSGYRASYFKELAEKAVEGNFNTEDWLKSDLSTKELKKEMKKIKGVGNYAAENLLKLLGRYDGLALDSWLRGKFYEKYNNKQICEDKIIESHYEKFGEWRGLVIWYEMSK